MDIYASYASQLSFPSSCKDTNSASKCWEPNHLGGRRILKFKILSYKSFYKKDDWGVDFTVVHHVASDGAVCFVPCVYNEQPCLRGMGNLLQYKVTTFTTRLTILNESITGLNKVPVWLWQYYNDVVLRYSDG